MKGKTTHTTQKHVEDLQDMPQERMEKHGEYTLAIDIMFINKIPFVMTMSHNIHFGSVELIKDMKNNTLLTSIEQVTSGMWIQDKCNTCRQAIQTYTTIN